MDKKPLHVYSTEKIIIDEFSFHLKEYEEMFQLSLAYGIEEFYFGGSRFSGKTMAIVFFILFNMMQNRNANWICVMWNKIDHSKRTMAEFYTVINEFIGTKWKGFSNYWRKVDSPTEKEWIFKIGDREQRVLFWGKDDMDKGTTAIGWGEVGAFYQGAWVEEPSGTTDMAALNRDAKADFLDKYRRMEGNVVRRLKDGRKDAFYKMFTFNPYNEEDEIIEPWVKGHDALITEKQEKELLEKGLLYRFDRENKRLLATTNYLLPLRAGVLSSKAVEFLERMKINNYSAWRTDGLGRAGKSTNSAYSIIWPTLELKQEDIEIRKKMENHFNHKFYALSIDWGYGNADTVLTLWIKIKYLGKELWIPRHQCGYNKEIDKGNQSFNPEVIYMKMIKQIKEWEYLYPRMEGWIPVKVDYDRVAAQFFHKLMSESDIYLKFRGRYNIIPAKEKHLKKFKNAVRPLIISTLISLGNFVLIEDYTPEAYMQFKLTRYSKDKFVRIHKSDKKIHDIVAGEDDYRQSIEIFLLSEMDYLFQNTEISLLSGDVRSILSI